METIGKGDDILYGGDPTIDYDTLEYTKNDTLWGGEGDDTYFITEKAYDIHVYDSDGKGSVYIYHDGILTSV